MSGGHTGAAIEQFGNGVEIDVDGARAIGTMLDAAVAMAEAG